MQTAAATPLSIRPSAARRIAGLGRQEGHVLPAATIVAVLEALGGDVLAAGGDLMIGLVHEA